MKLQLKQVLLYHKQSLRNQNLLGMVSSAMCKGSRNAVSQGTTYFKSVRLSACKVAERVNDVAGHVQCQRKDESIDVTVYSVAIGREHKFYRYCKTRYFYSRC